VVRSLLRSFRVPGANSFYLREFVRQEYLHSKQFTDIHLQAVSIQFTPAVDGVQNVFRHNIGDGGLTCTISKHVIKWRNLQMMPMTENSVYNRQIMEGYYRRYTSMDLNFPAKAPYPFLEEL
jgi:hypothetical protein